MVEASALKSARLTSGLTQEAAAKAMEVSVPKLRILEMEPGKMTIDQFFLIRGVVSDEGRGKLDCYLEGRYGGDFLASDNS